MGRGNRNDEIEVLRAFAVLFVVIGHISTLLYWQHVVFDQYVNLSVGVDLFFCISGFVITSAFGAEIAAAVADPPRYWRTVAAFWIRRSYRILPLSWAVFAGTLVVLAFVQGLNATLLQRSLGDFIAIAFNVENIHYGSCVAVDTLYCGSFGVYWSLSLEEQFYFAFPLLFLLPRKVMIFGLIAAVVTFAFLPRTTMVWMTRIDAIALGVLLAFARSSVAYEAFTPTMLSNATLRWAVLAILVCGMAVIPTGIVPFAPTMVSLISLLMVFVASYDRGFLMAPGLVRSGLVWIGQRSFAIYLIHNAVFWAIGGAWRWLLPSTQPHISAFVVAAIVLIAVLADLSFRFIETPMRRRGKHVASKFQQDGLRPSGPSEPVLLRAAE